MIFPMGMDSCFFPFWGHRRLWPQIPQNTGPYPFLYFYVSLQCFLMRYFPDHMRSTALSVDFNMAGIRSQTDPGKKGKDKKPESCLE